MNRIILFLALLPFMVVSANAQSLMVGDANGDGFLDISDVVAVVNRVLEGNPTSYRSCPDTNHPHLIDLGLPSGTLWSCCNVGAISPLSSGYLYAWGETETKYRYDGTTYRYCDNQDEEQCQDIGASIIGTQYDVATEKIGTSWQMPSHAQINELINNCTGEWIQIDDAKGFLFTGPNGKSIFFPAAGFALEDVFTIKAQKDGIGWGNVILLHYI